jgi:hypothetical protein
VLRGSIGADFENHGRISQDMGGMDCGCFGGGEGNRERLILVKGPFCFVFVNEKSPSPKFVVALKEMQVHLKLPASLRQVLMEPTFDGAEYELTFATETIAQEFVDAARVQHHAAATDCVRHRLGHDHLLDKTESYRYAEAVAHQALSSDMLSD